MVGAAQPWGVEYIDRYSAEGMVGAPSQTAAQALAAAFDTRGSRRNMPPIQERGFDGHTNATKALLRATGLVGVRDKRRGDLSRSQLLCLVLCVGAARALVGRMDCDERTGEPSIVASRQRRLQSRYSPCVAPKEHGSVFITWLGENEN